MHVFNFMQRDRASADEATVYSSYEENSTETLSKILENTTIASGMSDQMEDQVTQGRTDVNVEEEDTASMSEEEVMLARKAAILMEIMDSGASVEQTIEKYSDEIDHVMLELVEKRIQAARQLEQQDEAVQGLVALYKYLKAEHDRNSASPALRLLDVLLQIMSDVHVGETEIYSDVSRATRQKAMARMQMAFDASLPLETDPLSLAHHLAQGKTRMIDDMLNETVKPMEFIHEVEVLLGHAMEQHALLQKQVQGMELSENVREALQARGAAIDTVQEILVMARDISQRFRIQ